MPILAVMAAVWWIPTFMALADVYKREHIRRILVWKWTLLLCVPVVGALLYWRRGRAQFDAEEARNKATQPQDAVSRR